jgi:hypothetical protein
MKESLIAKQFDLYKNKSTKQNLRYFLGSKKDTAQFLNPALAGAALGGSLGLAKGGLEQDDNREVPVDERLLKVMTNSGAGALLGTGAGLVTDAIRKDYPSQINQLASATGLPGVNEPLRQRILRQRATQGAIGIKKPGLYNQAKDVLSIGKMDVDDTIGKAKRVLETAPGYIDKGTGAIIGGGAGSLIGSGIGHVAGEAVLPGLGGIIGQGLGGTLGGISGTIAGTVNGGITGIKTLIPGTDENLNARLGSLEKTNDKLGKLQEAEQQKLARQQAVADIGRAQRKADRSLEVQKRAQAFRQQQAQQQALQQGFRANPAAYVQARAQADLKNLTSRPVDSIVDGTRNILRTGSQAATKLRGILPFSYMGDTANFGFEVPRPMPAPPYVEGLKYGALAGAVGGGVAGTASALASQRDADEERLNTIAAIPDPYQRLRQYEIYNSDLTRLGKTASNITNTAGNAALAAGLGAGAGAALGGAGVIAYNKLANPMTWQNLYYGKPKPPRISRAINTLIYG